VVNETLRKKVDMEVINSAVFGAIAIGKQAIEEIFGIMNGRQ